MKSDGMIYMQNESKYNAKGGVMTYMYIAIVYDSRVMHYLKIIWQYNCPLYKIKLSNGLFK